MDGAERNQRDTVSLTWGAAQRDRDFDRFKFDDFTPTPVFTRFLVLGWERATRLLEYEAFCTPSAPSGCLDTPGSLLVQWASRLPRSLTAPTPHYYVTAANPRKSAFTDRPRHPGTVLVNLVTGAT